MLNQSFVFFPTDDIQEVALSTLDLPYTSTYMATQRSGVQTPSTSNQRINTYGVRTLEDIEEVQSQENSNNT